MLTATAMITAMITGIDMIPTPHLVTLMQWLSPAYPVGGFSYSHGLEWSVAAGDVTSAASFQEWLADVLEYGSGRNDAILLAAAYRATDDAALAQVDAFARALAPSSERLLETTAQGAAFVRTTATIWDMDLPVLCYPVAVGRAAALIGVRLEQVLPLYLHGFASNLTGAAMRLVPLGQTDGQRVLAAMTPLCDLLAQEAAAGCGLDDLGGAVMLADIAAMKHETQYTRLFRS
ncbi:MAG: urease accessory protein UreF [Rhodobacterales bacterium]